MNSLPWNIAFCSPLSSCQRRQILLRLQWTPSAFQPSWSSPLLLKFLVFMAVCTRVGSAKLTSWVIHRTPQTLVNAKLSSQLLLLILLMGVDAIEMTQWVVPLPYTPENPSSIPAPTQRWKAKMSSDLHLHVRSHAHTRTHTHTPHTTSGTNNINNSDRQNVSEVYSPHFQADRLPLLLPRRHAPRCLHMCRSGGNRISWRRDWWHGLNETWESLCCLLGSRKKSEAASPLHGALLHTNTRGSGL